MSTQPPSDYRLPAHVIPVHYDLKVWTDLQDLKFDGVVTVKLQIKKETSQIVLNSLGLDFDEVSLSSHAVEGAQHPTSTEFDTTQQRAIFTFTKSLPTNSQAELSIAFKSDITDFRAGYYKSLGGADGTTVYALTQFQPTAARRAFPCFDEPALKATFAITMLSRKDTVNISNMSVESEGPLSDAASEPGSWAWKKLLSFRRPSEWKITRFDTTPPMSTYIVAYANGPFEYLESTYTSPINGKVKPVRFYCTPDLTSQGHYSLELMAKVVPLFEQLFEVEYPLPKLDLLVATDYVGGMENWGLIIGQTQCFLYDPQATDMTTKKYIAGMVGHEVGHQWFGDITTMEWWDTLYLNEGFATLVGNKVVIEKLYPEWKPDLEFLGSDFFRARSLDAKLSSHPIEVECPDAGKILQIFDALSYSKAASVLRMLSSYVGEERFLKGVSLYLQKHQFGNTVTEDLWEGMKASTGLDIPKMMDNWVKKMGYPVITVIEQTGGIHVRQDRFLESGPAEPKDNETLWMVPLSILTVSAEGKPVIVNDILDTREKFIPFDTSKPFKLNPDTTGFYAVRYSAERLATLGRQVTTANSPFSAADRIGLVWDAFALAKAGYMSLGSVLELVSTFTHEEEYFVWNTIASNLSEIASTWYEHPDVVALLNSFRRNLFVPVAKRLGLEYSDDDSANDRQLRTVAIEQSAYAADPWVVGELTSRFAYFLKTGSDSKIPGDLMDVTYRIAVQEGGQAEWSLVRSLVPQPKTPAQGYAALHALGAPRDRARMEQTWAFLMAHGRNQDVLVCSRGLQDNPATRKFLAEKTKENFDVLEKRFAGTFHMIRWFELLFSALASEEDYAKTKAFFKNRDTTYFELQLKQSLDNIRSRAAWIKRSTGELVNWLEHRPGTA